MPTRFVLAIAALALLITLGGPVAHAAPPDPEGRARAVLLDQAPGLGLRPDLSDLSLADVRRGLAGDYVRFHRESGGIPILGADVVVGLPDGGEQPEVAGAGQASLSHSHAPPRVSSADALAAAYAALGASPEALRGQPDVQPAYLPSGGQSVLGWQVVLPLSDPLGMWLAGVDAADGGVLFVSNVMRFDQGRVFDPNPPRNSGGTIPPPSDCDSGANEPALSTQYVTKTLQGIAPGQDKLKGEFVDLTAPGITGAYKPAGQANEPSHTYLYPCTDDRFEEVMTYYHIDATQRQMQSLGFSGAAAILDNPVPAHAHYFGDCNAFYDPTDRGLHFGDGDFCGYSADAAEDADVIVHEYGHAIQDSQVPAWGFGPSAEAEEAWAMGEGFSDFLTAARFGDPCLGEWFSFGGSCLRTLVNTKTYPADYNACRPKPSQPAEEHCAGLIWGGALWDLAQALGGDQAARDTALTLVLESHFLLHPLATMNEGAAAVRQADAMLYGAAHAAVINSVFAARGLSTGGSISDFQYAYLRIEHPRRGHLDVDLLVGSTPSPLCSLAVYGPDYGDFYSGLVGYQTLAGSSCEAYLPPSPSQPWYLRVADVLPTYSGTLREFEIVLSGATRCVAADVPIAIPDAGGPVYSQVNCTNKIDGTLADDDGDGFSNATELYVTTDPSQPCGPGGWPADLSSASISLNKLDIIDLATYIGPVRRFDTSPGDAAFDRRWDVHPGPGVLSKTINIQDLAALVVLSPPMFGGQRAFSGPACQ